MNRLSSRKYLDGARNQPCTLRCSLNCDGGGDTTVFAHIRDRHTGRSIKASDISGADACFSCHAMFDGRGSRTLYPEEWTFFALRGLQETLENRIERGILVFPYDPPPKPSTKPPKAPGRKTKPIQSKGFGTQHRPLQSRGFGK